MTNSKMFKVIQILVLIFIVLLNFSCQKEEEPNENSNYPNCFRYWLGGEYQWREWRGGYLIVTQSSTSESCDYELRLRLTVDLGTNEISVGIGPNINDIFLLCDEVEGSSYVSGSDLCVTQFLDANYVNNDFDYRHEIFLVKDTSLRTFEGSAHIYEIDENGEENLEIEMIFSVPYNN